MNGDAYRHYALRTMNDSKIGIPIDLMELANGFYSMTILQSGEQVTPRVSFGCRQIRDAENRFYLNL